MEENERNNLQNRLVILLKLFKNRPNHLAKYLLENDSFTEEFLIKILESEKLTDISNIEIDKTFVFEDDEDMDDMDVYYKTFSNIEEMEEFYSSLIEVGKLDISEGSIKDNLKMGKEETEIALNERLKETIEDEDFEEAIKLRDYMISNNITINI